MTSSLLSQVHKQNSESAPLVGAVDLARFQEPRNKKLVEEPRTARDLPTLLPLAAVLHCACAETHSTRGTHVEAGDGDLVHEIVDVFEDAEHRVDGELELRAAVALCRVLQHLLRAQ